ncbi:four helix bundle protein [Candidatus Peregrinibacteria bacterium]|nr:four helix bundle protein [Candidatus Peregrinibacteria bacterium]MBI2524327.1 four helix bundle protein [Candidatus Peregrinibacteria bacterium]
MRIIPHITKSARYTIGARIENIFLDLLEQTYTAYFSAKEKKADRIAACVFTLDILKFLISVAWEGKLISHGQCEELTVKLGEVGKMLGGWQKSLGNPTKKNRDV